MKRLASILLRFSLCLMVLIWLVATTQAQTPGNKFLRSENPISGQYIVVLNGTGLSPTPEEPSSEMMSAETGSTETAGNEQVSAPKATDMTAEIGTDITPAETGNMEQMLLPDPELVSLAIDLTRLYGGQFVNTYDTAGKGFILRATEEEALAMSLDNRVLFVQEDGEIKLGSIQFHLPSWSVDRIQRRFLPPGNTVAAAVRNSIGPKLTSPNIAVNWKMNAPLFSPARMASDNFL
jgi:hypothetical protein